MGRPSLATERRRQILEAAIRCIAAHGLAATTLDGIAEEAGMARGHVRHYAGNRDAVLTDAAVLLYFGEVPEAGAEDPVAAHGGTFLPEDTATIEAALDYLFGDFAEPGPENTVALAFVDAARTNPSIHAIVVDAYLSSQSELAAILATTHPECEPDARADAAYGILTLAIGNVFMADLEVSAQRTASARRSAERLIAALPTSPTNDH
ncbi:TetR/AcrR family transcriptional regulator [Herbiconiux sp.]|uniref:TetR/AcrR family transcriptional regulator n=1 Tax=Herbiconiux sp. TaxID=1871186 RepID=UPI0025BEFE72|nr:TetR/AcrR family transcriptional regulator [Herbiconiux sp.]